MSLFVQKYGGTSLANAGCIRKVARRIANTWDKGNQVVVVASAMGDTTDDLIQLAHEISHRPSKRELDVLLSTGEIVSSTLLAMALKEIGYDAISLTGAQAGIQTDCAYSQAHILKIDASRVVAEIATGKIVIVAGFQGVTDGMDTTTLGRGGSDTTAVALAAALKADCCQRFTDVDGIYTADPRLVPEARRLDEISYEEMLEMATYGAKMVHPRAVELGEIFQVPIQVSSSFAEGPGTLIHRGVSAMEVRNKVRGIAHDFDVAKITVVGVPDLPGIAAAIFQPLAEAGISVDTIVQNASANNITDLTFTVAMGKLGEAMGVVESVAKSVGAVGCVSDDRLGKVSIIGTGMQNAPGYAARMFATLAEQNINIQMISTSEIRITCIVEESRVKDAVVALHQAFKLDTAD
ncbi:MAG: aspartate kinase [Chloroflexota bacterium]